jgi:hypothetical protein
MQTMHKFGHAGIAFIALVGLAAPQAAGAQGGGFPALQGRVQQLEAQVQSLQAAVAALQGGCRAKLSAQADQSPFLGFAVSNSPPVEINSLSITAPCDGYLVISGDVGINNSMTSAQFYALGAVVDGVDLFGGGQAAVQLDAMSSSSRTDMLGYTVTTRITAGTHTVSQKLGAIVGSASFSYSRNSLTVRFIPEDDGTLTAAP